MADTLLPWMRGYFNELVRNHGSNLSNAPVYTKRQKIQITKFLTYGGQSGDGEIWAEASDKEFLIPIKFTSNAISGFSQANVGHRFTQHKGAIAKIQNLRPISTVIPLLGAGQATAPSLAFECFSVSILGSSGEATFGTPTPLRSLTDIVSLNDSRNHTRRTDWSEGRSVNQSPSQFMALHGQINSKIDPTRKTPKTTLLSTMDPGRSTDVPSIRIPVTEYKTQDLKTYTATWQLVAKSRKFEIDNTISEQDLCTESKSKSPQNDEEESFSGQVEARKPRLRSASLISGWTPSPIATRKEESLVQASKSDRPSSDLLPTSAQVKRNSAVPLTPNYLSSNPMGIETMMESELGENQHMELGNERHMIPRKIPRPISPEPPKGTGPVLILAPNSDTSGTQSQSQASEFKPIFKRDGMGRRGGILGAVSDRVEDAQMDEDYPWMNLWELRAMMGRIIEARVDD